MTIYTGRGDEGVTDLHDRTRVSKASNRIAAYGTVDELNAVIGTIVPTGHTDIDDALTAIQNQLHIVQAELANPASGADDPSIKETHVEQLEAWIDDADEELDPLRSFILPGGGQSGAALHFARTVCRRAERRAVACMEETEEDITVVIIYLNRLSDTLFTLARLTNAREGFEERNPTY